MAGNRPSLRELPGHVGDRRGMHKSAILGTVTSGAVLSTWLFPETPEHPCKGSEDVIGPITGP